MNVCIDKGTFLKMLADNINFSFVLYLLELMFFLIVYKTVFCSYWLIWVTGTKLCSLIG